MPFISPEQRKNHPGISNVRQEDLDSMLPQLTSPLSPPAFNPHEIILDSNEAIAGLESPAPNAGATASAAAAFNASLMNQKFSGKDFQDIVVILRIRSRLNLVKALMISF